VVSPGLASRAVRTTCTLWSGRSTKQFLINADPSDEIWTSARGGYYRTQHPNSSYISNLWHRLLNDIQQYFGSSQNMTSMTSQALNEVFLIAFAPHGPYQNSKTVNNPGYDAYFRERGSLDGQHAAREPLQPKT
jgi:hypothetical protein